VISKSRVFFEPISPGWSMKVVNIEGLPEAVAAAVQQMVETLRSQFATPRRAAKAVELPRWPGKVLGGLTREEIYRDVG